MKAIAGRVVRRSLRSMSSSVQSRMIREINLAQGRGWGSFTVSEEVGAALTLLPKGLRDTPVVLDVGANKGEWTSALINASRGATVYAFEPGTKSFAALTTRFSDCPNIHLIHSAVSDHSGTALLWSDMPGSGLSSLSKRQLDHLGLDFEHHEPVALITLDAWRQEAMVDPVVLKIDVEGHEMAVLEGARTVIESVVVVQFEFGGCNIDSRTYFRDFWYFFRDIGFRLFRLSPKGLVLVEHYDEAEEVFLTTNFFAQRIK